MAPKSELTTCHHQQEQSGSICFSSRGKKIHPPAQRARKTERIIRPNHTALWSAGDENTIKTSVVERILRRSTLVKRTMGAFPLRFSIVIVILAITLYYLKSRPSTFLPWHETPEWKHALNVYDTRATANFADCDSRLMETSFGKTQIHACGDPNNPPVLFLHGAGSNSNLYGAWIMPALKESHYCVAVDFVCDVGRSIPQDGDPEKCPSTPEDLADWIKEIASGLSLTPPLSLVGYSYGCQVAFLTARHQPELVHKLILIAPAAVFAPIQMGWLWKAIIYGLARTDRMMNWFFRSMSVDPNFDLQTRPERELEEIISLRNVGGTVLKVQADSFEDDVLLQVIRDHPTLLVIGREETLINATLAADRAERAGALAIVYTNAGHLMVIEEPARTNVVKDVVAFLIENKHSE
jgi:pimeloyl-ACP methyl ester carboxylesterase